jgi:N-methylhydantoinase A
LGVNRLLVPPGAGVGSAIGFLRAPFSFEANRSIYMKLSGFDGAQIKGLLTDLEAEATGFVRTCDAESPILSEFKVYMRYTGQGWEIPIMLTPEQAMNPDAGTFEARFVEDYTKLFGRPVAGMDIEITVWSVNATTPSESVARVAETGGEGAALTSSSREVFDAASAAFVSANIFQRDDMQAGARVQGPAVITEAETTIIVPTSRDVICQPDGCIDIVMKG